MPDAIITSTESTFGTISGTFAADQSTITGTVTGIVAGTLDGTVGVPGPGVPLGGTEGQIIVKQSSTDYDTAWQDNYATELRATVRNETGATLTKGTVVYISGGAGNKPLVVKASASSESSSSKTFAILAEDIPNNQNGDATTMGLLKGIDTSAFTAGANLWLSTTAGQITQTMPASPNHAVFLGNAVRIHANQGEIEVRIQNGLELGELHDVLLTSPSNGQVLKYDSATGLWVNGTDVGVPAGGTAGQFLQKIDGTDYNTDWVTVNLSAYAVKANNLSDLTSFSDARDNLGLGTLNTPTFAGVTAQGSGSNVANLTPTSLSLTHATSGSFTIQPSVGITFPDSSVQTTAFTGSVATTWGSITGTLSSQTDLQTALDGKYSTSNPAGYITSSALSPYLTSATAASTYQTLAGMSSYLTTSAAASTYYPLTNPSGYITSSALAGYATESWVTAGFYPLSTNPAGYLTSASLSGYATESWVTSQLGSYLTTASAASTYLTQSNAASTYFTIANAANKADLASPAFTGNPTAPTPATADNDTSIATTAFVKAQGYLTSAPVTSVAGKTGAVTLAVADVSGAAPIASPTFTGTPAAPTASAGTSTTQLATTAFVTTANNLKANLASPALTGTPTAPTAAVDTNTTQLATTAYVVGQGYLKSATASSTYAPLASPALTGTPTAPTATAGTNTTQIATTAFVTSAVPAAATVAEVLSPTPSSTTKYISPATAAEMLIFPGYFQAYGLGNTSTSGTGATVFSTNGSSRWHSVRGPNAGVAGYAFYIFDYAFSGIGIAAAKRGGSLYAKDWSRKIWVSGRSTIATWAETISGLAGDANTFARVMLGGRSSSAAGGMQASEPGIGWKVAGGGSQALVLTVSNGSTLTEVTSTFTPVANQVFDWKIYSDGAGNVTLWVNETSVATSTAGPTTNNENYNFYCEVVDQTASATAPFGLSNYGTKVYWSI